MALSSLGRVELLLLEEPDGGSVLLPPTELLTVVHVLENLKDI